VDTDDRSRSRAAGAGRPAARDVLALYLTNECDAECLMCGMRRTNDELVRETAPPATA
jgi:MoaA/NifB/PqqE/SkfB family radical SAM enzyme